MPRKIIATQVFGRSGEPGPTGDVTPAALAAKTAAETARNAAQAARTGAETARDDAQAAAAAAELHKDAVEAVVATNDGIMTSVANDPGSDFHSALTGAIEDETTQKIVEGGRFPMPVRAPTLVVDRAWPQGTISYRILWTENGGETLYAWSAHDYRFRKSIDGGRTWTVKGFSGFIPSAQHAFLRTASGVLLAHQQGPTANIWRSTDDGDTWTKVWTSPVAGSYAMGSTSWVIDPLTGHIYYGPYTFTDVDTTLPVYRSTDDGATWDVFHTFPGYASTDPDKVRHVHSVMWDHVDGRVVFLVGDSDPAAGMYRVNAAGTGVEPVLLNRDIPGIPDGARAIGLIPFPDYICWTGDSSSNPYLMRMARSEIGKPSPQVERVYRLNSAGWFACRASDDGSRWVFSSSQEGGSSVRLDRAVHLYAVEDQGATVYEVAAVSPGFSGTSLPALSPVGAAHIHGDYFFLNGHAFDRDVTWRLTLAKGTTPLSIPQATAAVVTQVFNPGTHTWTKPPGARRVAITLIGPGSGGGSGARAAVGSNPGGGAGGAGGAILSATCNADDLPASVTVVVSPGGSGGAPVTTDDTAGVSGGAPSATGTRFGDYFVAFGGLSGGGGGKIGADSDASTPGPGVQPGGPGAVGRGTSSGLNASTPTGAPGGGGGGGVSGFTPTSHAGGTGGYPMWTAYSPSAGGAAPGGAGADGDTSPVTWVGTGGGGGAGGDASTPGGAGGAGGYGAGGGGGGASVNGQPSGKGGNGGRGVAIITTYF